VRDGERRNEEKRIVKRRSEKVEWNWRVEKSLEKPLFESGFSSGDKSKGAFNRIPTLLPNT
jgi:hypothetical protein